MAALKLKERSESGTGSARALRREGLIPGVLYGSDITPISFCLDKKKLSIEMHDPAFFSRLFEVTVGDKKHRALVKELQLHPVTDQPVHLDLLQVSKDKEISLFIPVHFTNEDKSPGLKRGGVLNIVLHELEITCPADTIPEGITIDLEGFDIGHAFHLDAIELPPKVKATHAERDNTLATIVAPTIATAEEEAEEAAAAEAAAEEGAEGVEAAEGKDEKDAEDKKEKEGE